MFNYRSLTERIIEEPMELQGDREFSTSLKVTWQPYTIYIFATYFSRDLVQLLVVSVRNYRY